MAVHVYLHDGFRRKDARESESVTRLRKHLESQGKSKAEIEAAVAKWKSGSATRGQFKSSKDAVEPGKATTPQEAYEEGNSYETRRRMLKRSSNPYSVERALSPEGKAIYEGWDKGWLDAQKSIRARMREITKE